MLLTVALGEPLCVKAALSCACTARASIEESVRCCSCLVIRALGRCLSAGCGCLQAVTFALPHMEAAACQ
jgi:hypothetical protein